MLTELHIENVVGFSVLDVHLGKGLTAITGESGSGKSVLLHALGLIAGHRADVQMVGMAGDEARVDARLINSDGEEMILTRVVPRTGRSRAYINGRPSTVAALASLADTWCEIHSQHEHHRLRERSTQRALVDSVGGVDLTELADLAAQISVLDAELAATGGDPESREREHDLTRYQLSEIAAAEIHDVNEDVALRHVVAELSNVVAIRAALEHGVSVLDDDSALSNLVAVLAGHETLTEITERLRGLLEEQRDIVSEMRQRSLGLNDDPDALAVAHDRLALLGDIRRRFGPELADVVVYRSALEKRLAELEDHEGRRARIDAARAVLEAEHERVAGEVATQRRHGADLLERALHEALTKLDMSAAVISIATDGLAGHDVDIRVSTIPGTPPLPLARVASGGEIARIMLAIDLIEAEHMSTGPRTIVLDEIDAGLGGEGVASVAELLHALGEQHQVIVVTHQPLVAATADSHLSVTRGDLDGTPAHAQHVRDDDRISELARMLGDRHADAARARAIEILASRQRSSQHGSQ